MSRATAEITKSINAHQVWMDEYKSLFYEENPTAARLDHGDLTERLELRKRSISLRGVPYCHFSDVRQAELSTFQVVPGKRVP